MEGSDVVSATGGIVEVVGGAAKVALSVGTSGAISAGARSGLAMGALEVLPWEGLLEM